MKQQLPRRELLKQLASGALGASVLASGVLASGAVQAASVSGLLKGNIRHSVSRWTYGDLSIEALCQLVKKLGFSLLLYPNNLLNILFIKGLLLLMELA